MFLFIFPLVPFNIPQSVQSLSVRIYDAIKHPIDRTRTKSDRKPRVAAINPDMCVYTQTPKEKKEKKFKPSKRQKSTKNWETAMAVINLYSGVLSPGGYKLPDESFCEHGRGGME